jgi:hypothetical protein
VASVPEPVRRIAELLTSFEPSWCLCGGWAVDAWLGRRTRDHVDVDVVVFAEDQRAIHERLRGWRPVAHERVEDEHDDPWEGSPVAVGTHVHARADDGLELEVFLDERAGDAWVLRDEPRITVPVARAVATSPWNVPTAAPEVLCFFKATAYDETSPVGPRDHDRIDVDALEPTLTDEQRDWLRWAVAAVDRRHPWPNGW